MKEELKEIWDGLPGIGKLLVIIGLAIVAYLIFMRISSAIRASANIQEQKGVLNALQAAGITPSYPNSRYKVLADELYESMDGPGTYEDDLFDVFEQMNNDMDIIKLESAFGIRENSDLQGWLDGDLSDSEMERLNRLLINKGINRTF